MKTLRDPGRAKRWATEQECIRGAADARPFSRDLNEADARLALALVARLTYDLIDAERWTRQRAQELLEDIWSCGPGGWLDVPIAA
jgi:hypothetical protein